VSRNKPDGSDVAAFDVTPSSDKTLEGRHGSADPGWPGPTADDMRLTKLTTAAALALTLGSLSAFAAEPTATARCFELLEGEDIVDEAISVCAAAAKESREGLVLYGDILSAQNNQEAAVEHYTKALDGVDVSLSDETTVAALRRRAIMYYLTEQRALSYKDAVAYLRHEPDDDELLYVAARMAPSPQAGLPHIERAIALKPEDIVQYGVHARLLLDLGKNNEAHATADRALKIAPKNANSLSIKAMVHSLLGEHAKAERLRAQAVRIAPTDVQAKAHHVDSLISLKRYEQAINVATAGLKDDPDHLDLHGLRALAYLAMGDGAAALADIARVKELRPQWDVSPEEDRAKKLIRIHDAISPGGIAKLQADRQLAMNGITRHLHSQCGNYRVPEFYEGMDTDEANADLERYRNCFRTWLNIPEIEIHDSLTEAEVAAGDRVYDAKVLALDAEELRCSKMPKRSKCVQDATLTRIAPLLEGAEDLFTLVRNIEVGRLNSGLAALNKAIERHNRNVEIAEFVNALADALNE
jgi:tetratricopeptide (TPR) repeat protein